MQLRFKPKTAKRNAKSIDPLESGSSFVTKSVNGGESMSGRGYKYAAFSIEQLRSGHDYALCWSWNANLNADL